MDGCRPIRMVRWSNMSRDQIQQWGAISILSGLGGTLAAAFILWVANGVSNVEPVVAAMDRLSAQIQADQKVNMVQHAEFTSMIYEQNRKMGINEHRLKEVEKACIRNADEIDDCKEEH